MKEHMLLMVYIRTKTSESILTVSINLSTVPHFMTTLTMTIVFMNTVLSITFMEQRKITI